MIEIEVFLNGELWNKIYAEYYGIYTSNPCGYEFFMGREHPHYETRSFVKTYLRSMDNEGAEFYHDGKRISLFELEKLLCLRR